MADFTDLERQAAERLDASTYAYYAAGADEQLTLADNVAAWRRVRLRPRVLRDVSRVSTASQALGHPLAFPLIVAPFAVQGLLHPGGEPETARAAAAEGTIMTLSTYSSRAPDEVAAAAGDMPWWFQLYLMRDRGFTREVVDAIAAAGARALVVTVDTPYAGHRPLTAAAGYTIPDAMFVRRPVGPRAAVPEMGQAGSEQDSAVTPADLAWLQEITPLPLVVKGVLRADDASACVEAGASAIVVSNHGGRQLDRSVASADALPEVVEAVGDAAEVYVDGGIRSGTDMLTALALGARAVLLGRPVAWGLATGGTAGVRGVLRTLRDELEFAMGLAGVSRIEEITGDLVAPPTR